MPNTSGIFYALPAVVGQIRDRVWSSNICVVHGVTIKADDDNTGDIFVGDSSVTINTGFRLRPGQAVTVEIDQPRKIWLISDQDSQKVYIMAA